ncbi:Uncharacterized protein APZ42_024419 [Daphnia magna]|uniref:Uncharacterized protein n=1 Tax=Daphnia magna TaxID=35525 RepID=A0A164U202_9CRUS|nr:Uncharacterized protein APZ42_024419 [Daphnia magna]
MLTGCRDPGAFCLLIEQRSKQLDTASSLFQFPIFLFFKLYVFPSPLLLHILHIFFSSQNI